MIIIQMTFSSFFTCRHPDQWQMRNIIQIRLKIRMKRAMDFSTCKILSQYLHITIKVIKISRTIMSIKVTTTFVNWLPWSPLKSPLSTGFHVHHQRHFCQLASMVTIKVTFVNWLPPLCNLSSSSALVFRSRS